MNIADETEKIFNMSELVYLNLENNNIKTKTEVFYNLLSDESFMRMLKPIEGIDEIGLKTLGLQFGDCLNRAIFKTIQDKVNNNAKQHS